MELRTPSKSDSGIGYQQLFHAAPDFNRPDSNVIGFLRDRRGRGRDQRRTLAPIGRDCAESALIWSEPHMPLPWRETLAMLLPPATFYRRRIAQEARAGEPELAVLDTLVRRGGTAIDIGANQGIFAFAGIAGRVVCFEPNPAAPRPRTPVAPHNGPYRERLITRVKSTRATPLRPVQDNRRLGAQR